MGSTNNTKCECGRPVGKNRTGLGRFICDRCHRIEQAMKHKTGGPTTGVTAGKARWRSGIGLEPYAVHLPAARSWC